jgi:ABC-type enterobactin transport system permease subunit
VERLAQLLDDLDDLISMIGLVSERIRKFMLTVVVTFTTVALQVAGVLLALAHPPIALATAILLFVSLLYHKVTSPRLEIV